MDYVYTHFLSHVLRLGLHVQIRLYCVLPYKAKISAQHGIGFILDRCIVYLGLTMPNLQKKRLLIFEIFNIKKCTFCFWNRVYISSCLSYFYSPSHEYSTFSVKRIFRKTVIKKITYIYSGVV